MNKKNFDIIAGKEINVIKPSYTGWQNWINEREPHNYGHLDFITSGQIKITIDDKTYTVGKNQILAIPKNKYYYSKVWGDYSYFSFIFDYETGSKDTDFPFPVCFETENIQYFLDKYKSAYNLNIIKPYGYKIKTREIFYDVLNKICEENYNKTFFNSGCYSIRKSIEFIDKNYTNPDLTLQQVADISSITDTHFRRIFKSFYGMTPVTYINKLRLSKAKTLLANTNLSIEQISLKCGFNEYSYFTRLFKKQFGQTPTNYREENKKI
ncbi:MAG: helix-turn-helix transcriptional regulator [Ruminococcaceae bacterium]|nr:helix-turn-helix transcriptional regulator [Oscillospiraceae bacterium]